MRIGSKALASIKIILLCFLFIFGVAHANDTEYGMDNGAIKFLQQPYVSMDSERLVISNDHISVDYVFTNNHDQDQVIDIAFPMPAMYFGVGQENNISDFKLFVNEKEKSTMRRFAVDLDGKDITKEIFEMGWTEDSLMNLYKENHDGKIREQSLARLKLNWVDDNNKLRFTLHYYFVWNQTFPARGSVNIRHAYTPSATGGVPRGFDEIKELHQKEVCMDNSFARAITKREKANKIYNYQWSVVSYVLKTGTNWKGAIKDFHLVIKKENPRELISLCFNDKLRKTSPTTFEFRRKNFTPKQDLKILFLL